MTSRLSNSTLPSLLILLCLLAACSPDAAPVPGAGFEVGKSTFAVYCASCHQLNGTGSEGRVPPLDGSAWITGPEERLVRIVLHGLRGSIEVRGQIYNLEMLGFGQILSDAQIAGVLSYVRERFGGGARSIDSATVAAVRAGTRDRLVYWTVAELLEIR